MLDMSLGAERFFLLGVMRILLPSLSNLSFKGSRLDIILFLWVAINIVSEVTDQSLELIDVSGT
jgi:hypothetical protein